MDLHQVKCEGCKSHIPLVRKTLAFRPVPKELECPSCGHVTHTTFTYRTLALFYWTWRTYMVLGMVLFILADCARRGYFSHKFAMRYLTGYIVHHGPLVFIVFSLIGLATSVTIQGAIDYVFKPGEKR